MPQEQLRSQLQQPELEAPEVLVALVALVALEEQAELPELQMEAQED